MGKFKIIIAIIASVLLLWGLYNLIKTGHALDLFAFIFIIVMIGFFIKVLLYAMNKSKG